MLKIYINLIKYLIISIQNKIKLALSYDCLGLSYRNKGLWKEASESHEKALKLLKDNYGSKHPNVAVSLRRLATIHE